MAIGEFAWMRAGMQEDAAHRCSRLNVIVLPLVVYRLLHASRSARASHAAVMSVKEAINDASKAVLKGGKDMKGLHNFISEIRNYIYAPMSAPLSLTARAPNTQGAPFA